MNLTQAVKNQANQLGFSLAGVTTPDPPPHLDVFEAWLDHGRQGGMAYLASPRSRHCRADPKAILPECRSVLVLGLRYPAPLQQEDRLASSPPRGRIAAYAWGEDYHHVLPGRLEELVRFIESQVGYSLPNRWYTDTGSVLERELAMRAGLGWIGRNTCLINPHQGSYFFLAEILLGVELEPDPPFSTDRCGTCSRCIQACPTGCILPDRTLDARRCISYLTIELKGSISPELRPQMGGWVFGCDICQQVCPWNRFTAHKVDSSFEPHLAPPAPNLLEELSLSSTDFNRKYSRSPLRRAKRRGYLRNVATALGSLRSHTAESALSHLLKTEAEPLVRMHAAWSLGQIGGPSARQTLEDQLPVEADTDVRLEIQSALAHLPGGS